MRSASRAAADLVGRPLSATVNSSRTKSTAATSASLGYSRLRLSQQSSYIPRYTPAGSAHNHKAWPRSFSTTARRAEDLKTTPLHELHITHGGKMVPFGGYSMPVQYADQSVRDSHLWTRDKASIFDVSHMVQHRLQGPAAEPLLSALTPAGLASLPNHHSTLSALLHPLTGGIVDDTVITRLGPQSFYFVTNAACRDKVLAHLTANIDAWKAEHGTPASDLQWEVLDDYGLVALQGPDSAAILEPLLLDMQDATLSALHFGQSKFCTVQLADGKKSLPLLLSRGGYTGEDGFEISVPATEASALTATLLNSAGPSRLRLAGLGARDSLRLEAGMCLYGHDLDDSTTPAEAGLGWIVGRERRGEPSFHGAETVLPQLVPRTKGGAGTTRRRVGLASLSGPPAREGAEILGADGERVGVVTSGCPSPTLGRNIAMGYVASGSQKAGTQLQVVVRGKKHPAEVVKMPFVPSRYWKGGATPG